MMSGKYLVEVAESQMDTGEDGLEQEEDERKMEAVENPFRDNPVEETTTVGSSGSDALLTGNVTKADASVQQNSALFLHL